MSHDFQMPDVFVVPPEEDQVPGWCCFNAAQPLEEQGNMVKDQVPQVEFLEDIDDELFNTNHRTGPWTNSERQSVVSSLMNREYNIDHATADSDSDLDYETDYDDDQPPRHRHHPNQKNSPRSVQDTTQDSDVIEVVKVSRSKRCEENQDRQPPPPPGMKRSATFKAKASKAFRTLSGAFRASKPRASEVVPSRPCSRASSNPNLHQEDIIEEQLPQPDAVPRPPAASISRRFSQLFSTPSIKSRNSIISIHNQPSEDQVDSSPSEPTPFHRPSFESHVPQSSSRRTSVYQDTLTSATDLHPRAPSPNTSTRFRNRRFSKVNLQKLFSFSSSQQDPDTQPQPPHSSMESGRTTPTLKRKSSSLPSTSSESSAGPPTPTATEDVGPVIRLATKQSGLYDEGVRTPLDFEGFGAGLGILPSDSSEPQLSRKSSYEEQGTPPLFRRFSTSRSSMETTTSAREPPPIYPNPIPSTQRQHPHEPERDKGDISFEMRLDSLHFDDLSFDADRFIIGDES